MNMLLLFSTSNKPSILRFSILKTEVTFSSETSVDFQRTTKRYIPEDSTLHYYRCENLKSYKKRCDHFYNKFAFYRELGKGTTNSDRLDWLTSTDNNFMSQPQKFFKIYLLFEKKESYGSIQFEDVGYIDGSSAVDDACFQSVYNNIVLQTSPLLMQFSELSSLAPISDPYVCKAIEKINPKSAGLDDTLGFVLKGS
jgi:hypothetical protein